MRHQNSVFHHLLKHIPWAVFDRLVEEHGTDELVRKFKTRHQLIALLYGQLAGASSLREIEATMASHRARLYHVGSAANVNDIVAAKTMPIEPGATYVFDLGYYDYAWWAELDRACCRIVTRFKTNTPLGQARDMPLQPGSSVLSDRIGFLPGRQAKSRKNPMQVAVREVIVMTDTGKRLRVLANDLDAPAQAVGQARP